jgi:hypothetical protein
MSPSERVEPTGRYPKNGSQEQKQAWAKADTARRTAQANTGWQGEDLTVPLLKVTVDRRSGQLLDLRLVPRKVPAFQNVCVTTRPREPRARRNVRTGPRRARAPADDDPPLPDRLAALATISTPPTSESLRRRVLAASNGAAS